MDRSDLCGGPDWSRTSGTRFRKPLLYPPELRGHGAGTLVHRFNLREAALALHEAGLEPQLGAHPLAIVDHHGRVEEVDGRRRTELLFDERPPLPVVEPVRGRARFPHVDAAGADLTSAGTARA